MHVKPIFNCHCTYHGLWYVQSLFGWIPHASLFLRFLKLLLTLDLNHLWIAVKVVLFLNTKDSIIVLYAIFTVFGLLKFIVADASGYGFIIYCVINIWAKYAFIIKIFNTLYNFIEGVYPFNVEDTQDGAKNHPYWSIDLTFSGR